MGNPLAQLMAMLQGSPMSRLPAERQGVGADFGLGGSQVRGSDLADVLRNLPEDQIKMGMMPVGPGGIRPSIDQGVLSPNGRVSGRAREQALERVRQELFGPGGLAAPTTAQPGMRDVLLRQAQELRDLASRGMKPRAYLKKAEELERQAAGLQ